MRNKVLCWSISRNKCEIHDYTVFNCHFLKVYPTDLEEILYFLLASLLYIVIGKPISPFAYLDITEKNCSKKSGILGLCFDLAL